MARRKRTTKAHCNLRERYTSKSRNQLKVALEDLVHYKGAHLKSINKGLESDILKESDEPQRIYLKLRHTPRKQLVYATPFSCAPIYWDFGRERIGATGKVANSQQINIMLGQLCDLIEVECGAFGARGEKVNEAEVRAQLDAKLGRQSKLRSSRTLMGIIAESHLKVAIYEDPKNKSSKIIGYTHKNYQGLQNIVARFARDRYPIEFDTIGRLFSKDFNDYCTTVANHKPFTQARNYNYLKSIMSDAVELGYTENLKYLDKKFKPDVPVSVSKRALKGKHGKIFLSTEELEQIAAAPMIKAKGGQALSPPMAERLRETRDAFVLACCMGLRFSDSDTNKLKLEKTQENERYYFTHAPKKSDHLAVVAQVLLDPLAQKIMEHRNWSRPTVPKNNDTARYHVRLILLNAGITEQQPYLKWVGGKYQISSSPKWMLGEWHTARRSFVTNLRKRGVSYADIMTMGGWLSIDMVKQYDRTSGEDVVQRLSNSEGIYPKADSGS